MINSNDKIYVTGHNEMVGSAIDRKKLWLLPILLVLVLFGALSVLSQIPQLHHLFILFFK